MTKGNTNFVVIFAKLRMKHFSVIVVIVYLSQKQALGKMRRLDKKKELPMP